MGMENGHPTTVVVRTPTPILKLQGSLRAEMVMVTVVASTPPFSGFGDASGEGGVKVTTPSLLQFLRL